MDSEAIIGAVIVWAVAALMLFFPDNMLKVQKDTYKFIGVDFIYSDKTVKFIRFLGLFLIGIGLVILVYG